MHRQDNRTRSSIYTVSELTSGIKACLEDRYPFVWIQGEISGLSRPASGHMYFTLKDSKAQISAVIFKNQGLRLKFSLENGLQITGLARLSVYEPRGTYQLIFEHLEPKGAGALQLAFEQLKTKLTDEGLFDSSHKKDLPILPRRISVITSPSGAVIHDIIHVVGRRFPNLILEVVPVRVQGDTADQDIEAALSMVNHRKMSDLIIIARGGGSLEDLMPFNSERLARAVFSSTIPVVSAVGHETDFTICDFVADFRAPTPSAAAESVVPVKQRLTDHLNGLNNRMKQAMISKLDIKRSQLAQRLAKLVDPKRRIIDNRLKIEDLTERLIRSVENNLFRQRNRLNWKLETLMLVNPRQKINQLRSHLAIADTTLSARPKALIHENRMKLRELNGRLLALSPSAILDRGYSITRTLPDHTILRDTETVCPDQELEVILSKGSLVCRVKGTTHHGKEKL